MMRAVVRREYGSPDVLAIEDIAEPAAAGNEVLVRVHAASVNPYDWHSLTGTPYLMRAGTGWRRPKDTRLGVDFAGTVEAVGPDVTRFQPGDEVFGGRGGAFAEYLSIPEDGGVVPKPAGLTFEQAAAIPIAGLTALQGLRDKGKIHSGYRVLVNGASGGVGTFAVQIGKALGADVTGVCSTRNVDIVKSLGADQVIDYTQADFTRGDRHYDLILDNAGSRSWRECKRVLTPQATLVIVGGPKTNRWLGPMAHVAKTGLAAWPGSRKAVFFVADLTTADLTAMGELAESGKVIPHIDRQYELGDIAQAMRYLGEGHAQGKVVVSV